MKAIIFITLVTLFFSQSVFGKILYRDKAGHNYLLSCAKKAQKFQKVLKQAERVARPGRIVVTSGYRPPKMNRRRGGKKRSMHLHKCGAIDFYVQGSNAGRKRVRSLLYSGYKSRRFSVGFYCSGSFHVDFRKGRAWGCVPGKKYKRRRGKNVYAQKRCRYKNRKKRNRCLGKRRYASRKKKRRGKKKYMSNAAWRRHVARKRRLRKVRRRRVSSKTAVAIN